MVTVVPFTGSHVAAVLPLVRTPLISSALVVGSMVPDLPLFFRLPLYGYTHSVSGVFLIDAAAAFAVLAIWHKVLAHPTYATAPSAVRCRLPVPAAQTRLKAQGWPRRLLLTYASVVIGAATHVTWDAFTHPSGWGTRHIQWLAASHGPLQGYHWAQYASSLLGGAVVAAWLAFWWRRSRPRDRADSTKVAGSGRESATWLATLLAGGVMAAAVAGVVLARSWNPHRAVFLAVIYGIGTIVSLAMLLAIGWHLSRLQKPS